MPERVQRILASDRFPLLAALVAVLLLAPSLRGGLFADDLIHHLSFRPEVRAPTGVRGATRGDWDLFNFHPGQTREASMDLGLAPWWTDPHFRLAFFRPLSSLWHALDYRVWPQVPWLMHLESVVLFAVMVVLAAWLYRRLITPRWAAAAAAFFFAVDDAHGPLVAWVANRHALLSGVFVLAALLVHVRARQERPRRPGVFAPVLFALALSAGESGLAGLAYLVAYAVWLDQGSWPRRLASLLPYLGVSIAWVAIYWGLGYGAAGTGFYVDPGTDPLGYADALVQRMPVLLLSQFVGVPSWAFGLEATGMALPTLVGIIAGLGLLGLVLAQTNGRDRRAGFFATGMVLSLLPACIAWPQERMLLLPGVGAFGLIGLFLAARESVPRGFRGSLARATAIILVVIHGVVAPLLLPVRSVLFAAVSRDYVERGANSLPDDLDPNGTTLVILNAPDNLLVTYALADRLTRGRAIPSQVRVLGVAVQGEMSVTRVDERTISVDLSQGLLHDVVSSLYRGPNAPFAPGDVVAIAGMRATVMDTLRDGRPRRVHFSFDEPLDSSRYRWVRWEKTRFVPVTIPRSGATLTFPAIDYVQAVLGRE